MKNLIYKIDVMHLAVVLFLGAAMIIAIFNQSQDLANTIGIGLVGYLGGASASASSESKTKPKEPDDSQK